jgi:hypothetical protein
MTMMVTLMSQMTMSQILTNSSLLMHLVVGLLVLGTDGLNLFPSELMLILLHLFYSTCLIAVQGCCKISQDFI